MEGGTPQKSARIKKASSCCKTLALGTNGLPGLCPPRSLVLISPPDRLLYFPRLTPQRGWTWTTLPNSGSRAPEISKSFWVLVSYILVCPSLQNWELFVGPCYTAQFSHFSHTSKCLNVGAEALDLELCSPGWDAVSIFGTPDMEVAWIAPEKIPSHFSRPRFHLSGFFLTWCARFFALFAMTIH